MVRELTPAEIDALQDPRASLAGRRVFTEDDLWFSVSAATLDRLKVVWGDDWERNLAGVARMLEGRGASMPQFRLERPLTA